MDAEERKKMPKLKEMFVDCGANDAQDATELGVEIGSPITMDRQFTRLANDYVTGKAFDNRAGLAMMVSALQRLQGRTVKATILAVGTVQEEVGLKGARTSAFGLDPDVAIATDVTIPGDHPGVSKNECHVSTGKGPGITIMDAAGRGVIAPRPVIRWLRESADMESIPYQLIRGRRRQHRRDGHQHHEGRHPVQCHQLPHPLYPLAGGGALAARPGQRSRPHSRGDRSGAPALLGSTRSDPARFRLPPADSARYPLTALTAGRLRRLKPYLSQERFRFYRVVGAGDGAEAHLQGQAFRAEYEPGVLRFGGETFGDRMRGLPVCLVHHDDELIPRTQEPRVHFTYVRSDEICQISQGGVCGCLTEGTIDPGHVVDVDHEQSKRATVASVALDMSLNLAQHVPRVVEGKKRLSTKTCVRHVASPSATSGYDAMMELLGFLSTDVRHALTAEQVSTFPRLLQAMRNPPPTS